MICIVHCITVCRLLYRVWEFPIELLCRIFFFRSWFNYLVLLPGKWIGFSYSKSLVRANKIYGKRLNSYSVTQHNKVLTQFCGGEIVFISLPNIGSFILAATVVIKCSEGSPQCSWCSYAGRLGFHMHFAVIFLSFHELVLIYEHMQL